MKDKDDTNTECEFHKYRREHGLAPFQELVMPEHADALAKIAEKCQKKCYARAVNNIDELCQLVDTLIWQVTELRLLIFGKVVGYDKILADFDKALLKTALDKEGE